MCFYETIQDKSAHITFKHTNPIYKMYFGVNIWTTESRQHQSITYFKPKGVQFILQFHNSQAYQFNQWYREKKKKHATHHVTK